MQKIFLILSLICIASCGATSSVTPSEHNTGSIESDGNPDILPPEHAPDELSNTGDDSLRDEITTTVIKSPDGNIETISTNGPAITPMTPEELDAFHRR